MEEIRRTKIKEAMKETLNVYEKLDLNMTEIEIVSRSQNVATGVAVAWGHEAKAKGCLGAHLILSDWRYIGEKWFDGDYKTPYDVESWELAGAKMVQVDGEKIKADTYYRCVDGEVVEADE